MFRLWSEAVQAKRQSVSAAGSEFKWHRSYSWLLVLMPFIGSAVYLSYQDTLLPIRTIQLSGTFRYINQQEVESAVQPAIGEGFFSLDINRVQQTLGDKPWVESISIRRIWPDRLDIAIVEKRPVARWDDTHLLSDKAVVYRARAKAFAELPLVYTAGNNPRQMLDLYYRLAGRFAELNETLVAVRKDSRGAAPAPTRFRLGPAGHVTPLASQTSGGLCHNTFSAGGTGDGRHVPPDPRSYGHIHRS